VGAGGIAEAGGVKEHIEQFVKQACVLDAECSITDRELFRVYAAWCNRAVKSFSTEELCGFREELETFGLRQARVQRNGGPQLRWWFGISLQSGFVHSAEVAA
jgi:hypothetical protein